MARQIALVSGTYQLFDIVGIGRIVKLLDISQVYYMLDQVKILWSNLSVIADYGSNLLGRYGAGFNEIRLDHMGSIHNGIFDDC